MTEYIKATAARIIIVAIIAAGGTAALSTAAMAETAPVNITPAATSTLVPAPVTLPVSVLYSNTPWG
ncbi:hypothetical protein OG589_33250 [Sphaerisporangium sp. NBC_01403]|uniref:hypothetical protein n=1 Tax=Sphaerisporangium sp. NBC_01403 TaxID=2903599 RepID=UPI0032535A3E